MAHKKHYTGAELIKHCYERIAEIEKQIEYLKEAQAAEAEQYPPIEGAELARVVKLRYIYLQNQTEVGKWCFTHIKGFADNQARANARTVEIIDNGKSEDIELDNLCKQIRENARKTIARYI